MEKEQRFNPEGKESPKGLLIWWLSRDEQAQIIPEQWLQIPIYIKNELASREGREGRGRLWVPKDIDLEEIPWDDNHPNAQRVTNESAGGIVFHSSDRQALAGLPGLITELNLDTHTDETE